MEEIRKTQAQHTAEINEVKRRIERLEENDTRHQEDIRHLYEAQAGTKAYVTQILNKIDQLETKLFTALTAATKGSQEERKDWKELLKYIIGATFGLVVYHLITKGG
ncbi:hypothetical protein HWB91_gp10 [Bacillus phage vB_BboS-125]|uniref:Uncharacterized protein n=1 Tax=Bacillus phage vB_BboS-125 TaxID=2419618 RepID=A0A3G3BW42_9CAUD|nr:hypothetical protein HWB91_gp10 [Bacillus phage vB_BboS-125]AYP68380.1 hypothetical protein BboS125_00010 [Bacillus phage vB_BboS-125]